MKAPGYAVIAALVCANFTGITRYVVALFAYAVISATIAAFRDSD